MDKKRYSNTYVLSFKQKYSEPPIGFHPVYIKQKRVQCAKTNECTNPTSANHATSTSNSTTIINNPTGKSVGKWENLEKIRAFASSDNSFIQRTRNRSTSEVLLGEVRSLLNKVTDKTFDNIIEKLAEIDYEQFDSEMIKQSINIFLSKAISDKDYAELYSQIGSIFKSKFDSFQSLLTGECINMCNKLFDTNSDIQKAKCLGLMRVLPHFQHENILIDEDIQHKILDIVCQKIHERKHNNDSYAQIAATGGCGLYIELICKYCESIPIEHNDNVKRDYSTLLNELKSIKTIPARMRFMVEDTLQIFNQ